MIIQLIKGNVYQKCNEVNEIKIFLKNRKGRKASFKHQILHKQSLHSPDYICAELSACL